MTTMDFDDMPTLTQMLAYKLVNKAKKREKAINRTHTQLQSIVRLVLHLAGFGFLTYAGFSWNMTAGLIVAGISCFVLSTLMTNSSQPGNESTPARTKPLPDPYVSGSRNG
jgi:hypothetical protein